MKRRVRIRRLQLFDQHFSHRLPVRLAEVFPESAHVRLLGMERASDSAIRQYAADHGYAIVTQDSDFAERSRLYGAPPQIVWLRCGNSTPQRIETLLRNNTDLILDMEGPGGAPYVEIF
jgi:predicted nuclease of predicted toxin-antitoxin system